MKNRCSLVLAFANRTILLFILATLIFAPAITAQITVFTYQGRLSDNGGPANASYDLSSALFSQASGGILIAGPLTNSAVSVSDGLFTMPLDFGPGIFAGADYFLEIAVRPTGGGAFTPLSPRQRITPTPSSIFATKASGLLGGAVTALNSLQNNITLAAGSNVTITPTGNLLTIAAPGGAGPWLLNGVNTFYSGGNVGIGTPSPATALHVKGTSEGIRIDGPTSGAANLAFMSFRDSNGTRIGYVGDGSSGDINVFLSADAGDVTLNTSAGRVLTAKADGKVGIGTTAPQGSLDVRGDVKLGANGQYFAASGEENLRIVRGAITDTGSISLGSGFQVSHLGTGRYGITFNTPFSGVPVVTATTDLPAGRTIHTAGVSTSAVTIWVVTTSGTTFVDGLFQFIAIGPR